MTDLTEIIINLFKANSILLSIMILSITIFGVIVGGMGLLEGYQYTSGNSRFSTRQATFTGAIMKLALGSAAAMGAVSARRRNARSAKRSAPGHPMRWVWMAHCGIASRLIV